MKSTITLAGGCFWCIEAVFESVLGVEAVESGYCNGDGSKPNYQAVCTGKSGYAEVVRVQFNSEQIPLAKILDIFFKVHDPTTKNRQGNDVGTQYRSGVYAHSPEQLIDVQTYMAALAKHYPPNALTTEVALEAGYHRAEDYHQHYFAQNPNQGYCMMVVSPKVEKLRQNFASLTKT